MHSFKFAFEFCGTINKDFYQIDKNRFFSSVVLEMWNKPSPGVTNKGVAMVSFTALMTVLTIILTVDFTGELKNIHLYTVLC